VFYRSRSIFMCPICPHVGSVLARESRPGRGGLVKNGRDRAVSGQGRPSHSLDQWSIPLPSAPHIGFLVQLRSVKCAGSSLLPECTGRARRVCCAKTRSWRLTWRFAFTRPLCRSQRRPRRMSR